MGYYCEVWVGASPDPWYTMLTTDEAERIAHSLWLQGEAVYIARIEDGEEVYCKAYNPNRARKGRKHQREITV